MSSTNSRQIEPELFDRLNRAGNLDRSLLFTDLENGDEERDQEQIVAITRATDDLVRFVRNFFIQFFYEGYNFDFDGFNEETASDLNSFFENRPGQQSKPPQGLPRPDNMIEEFGKYLDLDRDVIEGEYTEDPVSLKAVYCSFLPRFFRAFERDGARSISNYLAIMSRIRAASRVIQQKCI